MYMPAVALALMCKLQIMKTTWTLLKYTYKPVLYFSFQYAIFLILIVIIEIAAIVIAAIFKGKVGSY